MPNTSIEKKDNLNGVIKVNIAKSDYEDNIKKSLGNHKRQAKMNGFRQGMVPMSLVKKMYGNQVLFEEINKILDKEVNTHIQENKLELLGQPLPIMKDDLVFDINELSDFSFEYEIAYSPELNMEDLKSIHKIDHYEIQVDDTMLDEKIERMTKKYGSKIFPLSIEADDMVKVTLNEIDAEGNVIEGGVEKESYLSTAEIKNEEIKNTLIGKEKGHSFELDVFADIEGEKEQILSQKLGVAEADLSSSFFKAEITEISRSEACAVDQDLFNKVYGEDVVKSEEEFRSKLSDELAVFLEKQSEQRLFHDIKHESVAHLNVDFPEDFLKRWLVSTNEGKLTAEDIEKDFPMFLKDLKWNLLQNRMVKDNDIKVEMDDVKAHTKESVKQYFGLHIEDDKLEEIVGNLMKDKEHLNKSYETVMGERIFHVLKNELGIEKKSVTLKEFNEPHTHE